MRFFVILFTVGCGGMTAYSSNGMVAVDAGTYEVVVNTTETSCGEPTKNAKETWIIDKEDETYFTVVRGIGFTSQDGSLFFGDLLSKLGACEIAIDIYALLDKNEGGFDGDINIDANAGLCGGCKEKLKAIGKMLYEDNDE